MNTINGFEALARMHEIRNTGETFEMRHLTYNRRTQESSGLRTVRHCKTRPALPQEKFDVCAELYLPYTDIAAPIENQNRTCRKRLIRYVAFPPEYQLLKVTW